MKARLLSARAQIRDDRAAVEARLDDLGPPDALDADDVYRVAWDLHHAYTGCEAILERVLRLIDGRVPDGPSSHAELLRLAALEVEGLRPALIGADTEALLHDLRQFRHFVRHGYAVELDPERLRALVAATRSLQPLLTRDLDTLDRWLTALADGRD